MSTKIDGIFLIGTKISDGKFILTSRYLLEKKEPQKLIRYIMPNVRGAQECKRRLLANVVQSRFLYAAPNWSSSITSGAFKRMESVQRRTMFTRCTLLQNSILRGCSGCDIYAANKTTCGGKNVRLRLTRKKHRKDGAFGAVAERMGNIRQRKMDLQAHSRFYGHCGQGEDMDTFHLTQFLAGRGCFRDYRWIRYYEPLSDMRCGPRYRRVILRRMGTLAQRRATNVDEITSGNIINLNMFMSK